MFNWWKKKQEEKFQEYLRIHEENLKRKADEEAARQREMDAAAAKALVEQELARKNSDEPYVKIENEEVDSNGNIGIKMDWNPAFVRYLKEECGFSGNSEEQIVQKWLGALFRELYEDGKNDALNILNVPGMELTEERVKQISSDIKREVE